MLGPDVDANEKGLRCPSSPLSPSLPEQRLKPRMLAEGCEVRVLADPVVIPESVLHCLFEAIERTVGELFKSEEAGNVVAHSSIFRVDREGPLGPLESLGCFAQPATGHRTHGSRAWIIRVHL